MNTISRYFGIMSLDPNASQELKSATLMGTFSSSPQLQLITSVMKSKALNEHIRQEADAREKADGAIKALTAVVLDSIGSCLTDTQQKSLQSIFTDVLPLTEKALDKFVALSEVQQKGPQFNEIFTKLLAVDFSEEF